MIKSDHIKWVIAGGIGCYFFLKWKEGKDDGRLAGYAVNPSTLIDSAIPWLGINPIVGHVGKKALEKIIGFDKTNAIDASYRRLK